MSRQSNLTQARLKELLKYDPETGEFTRRLGRRGYAAGTRAGTAHPEGYIVITIDRVRYLAHRLAWFYIHGVWPPADTDHINGKRADNRIANLRCATRAENSQNVRCSRRGSELGVLGVSRNRDKFRACIRIAGVPTHLGTFPTIEEAEQAYLRAKAELHPFSTLSHAA